MPKLADCLLLDAKNERTVEFSAEELAAIHEAATKAISRACDGMKRNSLRHLIERTTDVLTRESAAAEVIQLNVTLVGSKPPIWRRIQTPDCTLARLHEIIQVVMGWEDYHLHRFKIGQTLYGIPDPMDADMGIRVRDERKVRLSEVVSGAGRRTRFLYEYDFGDNWQHEIVLEGIQPAEAGTNYPRCTDGKRACPPEDVGGLWGYEEFLAALADSTHEEHEHYLEWSGGEFDPEELSLDEVNQELWRLR